MKHAPTLFVGLISLVAFIGLSFLYQDGVTGNIASTQQIYGKPIPHTVTTKEPCRLVECGSATRIAYPAGEDEWGHVLCKCPGHKEIFYAISKIREY